MIEPVIDALTTVIRPACSAKNAMISSAMLPKVALRMPPTWGPVSAPSRSVDRPTIQARPRIEAADTIEHQRALDVHDEVHVRGDKRRERRWRRRQPAPAATGRPGPGSGRAKRLATWPHPTAWRRPRDRRRRPEHRRGGISASVRLPARRVQLPSRDTGLGADTARGLAAGNAGVHQALDRGPARPDDGLVGSRPGFPAGPLGCDRPRTGDRLTQPTTITISPRAGIVPSRARPASSPNDPRTTVSCSLVSSRHTAPGRSGPQASARSRQGGRGPAGRLEQDAAALVAADPRQSLASLAPAAGQEPLERPARSREPRRGHGGQHSRRSRHRHDASAGSRPCGDQPLARIGHHGRAGVRDERQVGAGGEVGQQVTLLASPLRAW